MIVEIPILLHGNEECLTVEYGRNQDVRASGFDALALPFPAENCLGYPVISAHFSNMRSTGYRRYCGFIQFIRRIENGKDESLSLDVDDYAREIGNPYFAYGYPASLFDAPCGNLRGCEALDWTAYTYLVDVPTPMNGEKLGFLAGFSWGYAEEKGGLQSVAALAMLTEEDFRRHCRQAEAETAYFSRMM